MGPLRVALTTELQCCGHVSANVKEQLDRTLKKAYLERNYRSL